MEHAVYNSERAICIYLALWSDVVLYSVTAFVFTAWRS